MQVARLMSPLSRLSQSLSWGPNHLSSCLWRRHYVKEFPDRKANNQVPDDYVLVLSEPIDENENNNVLMKITKQHDIDYSKLNPENVFRGLSQALINFENYMTDMDTKRSSELKPTREFFKDIEQQLYPLDTVFNVAIALQSVDGSEYQYPEIRNLINRYYEVRNERFGRTKEIIHEYVLDGFKKLPETDKKMVKMYYKKNTSGLFLKSLDASTQLPNYRQHLTNSIGRFRYNLAVVDQQFNHTVDDPDILASIASEFEDNPTLHHKERTPFKVTPSTYHKFMRVCPDRFVRQMLWQTYNRRCSPKSSPKNNNISVIDDIRVFRRKIADLSGFRSHLDYRLSDAMAQSKQQIVDMLQSMNEENVKELNDRLQELADYASDNSSGGSANQFSGDSGLQEYDVAYWTHRYAHDILIGHSEAHLKNYFSLPVVLNGMKQFFKSHLGIEIVTRESALAPAYWDKSVQTLDVKRNDKPLGSIVFDPYFRSNKQVLEPLYARIRCKSQDARLAPVRLVSTAFKQDINSKEAHLSFSDIANLFHSFAIVVQRLLYNYDYYELNVYGALEMDVNNFLPNLCMAHLLTNHKILQSCSAREAGASKPIDSELASRIVKAHSYFRCFRLWQELYQAHLDLEACASLRDINKLAEEIYPIYSPFPRSSDNFDFCAFRSIFGGSEDGTRYSNLWSKQLVNYCLSEIAQPIDGGKATIEADLTKVRTFNEKLIDSLYAPDNFNTRDRLLSLLGHNFDPTKTKFRFL